MELDLQKIIDLENKLDHYRKTEPTILFENEDT